MLEGLKLKFSILPPLSLTPPPEGRTSVVQEKVIWTFVPGWLEKGIVGEILCPCPLFFSRMFSVLKKNGKVRPIIDLSLLNRMLVIPKFRMENLGKIVGDIREVFWATSVDLEDAYFHIPIALEFQRFSSAGQNGSLLHFVIE